MKNINQTTFKGVTFSLVSLVFLSCREPINDTIIYDCNNSYTTNNHAKSIAIAATGKVTCNKEYVYLEFTDDVNQLEIVQINSTETTDTDQLSIIASYDLQKGIEHITVKDKTYGDFTCKNVYDVKESLPLYIYSAYELQNFHINEQFQKIYSTCPEWLENNNFQNYTLISDITYTDSQGSTSTVSLYQSFQQ